MARRRPNPGGAVAPATARGAIRSPESSGGGGDARNRRRREWGSGCDKSRVLGRLQTSTACLASPPWPCANSGDSSAALLCTEHGQTAAGELGHNGEASEGQRGSRGRGARPVRARLLPQLRRAIEDAQGGLDLRDSVTALLAGR